MFKAIGLPMLGVFIPLGAHLLCCPQPSITHVISTLLFFTLVALVLWHSAIWLVNVSHSQIKKSLPFGQRLLVLCVLAGSGAFLVAALAAYLWQRWMLPGSDTGAVVNTGIQFGLAGVFLVLVYENLSLAKERELDVKIVGQLDKERVQAELSALKSELGPHFIFNSLTTLTHLVSVAPDTAQNFTQKLSRVYKYFLINKDRELISLQDELRFIEDYFFLLQIRYDNGVQLKLHIPDTLEAMLVIPCSLQLLVENAIKHNSFSDKDPLFIHITVHNESVTVTNELRSKPYITPGTRIGLAHLHQHYRLVCHKDIVVEESEGRFAVTVPLIKQLSI